MGNSNIESPRGRASQVIISGLSRLHTADAHIGGLLLVLANPFSSHQLKELERENRHDKGPKFQKWQKMSSIMY